MDISLLIWSYQISLFLWVSSYPNVTIRVGDNYFWKIITIRGPYGTQKGAPRGPRQKKKKGFQKGSSKESGSSDESRYTSVKIPKKNSFSLKFFSPKFFLSPWPPFESRRGPELWLISKSSCHLLLLWHLDMKISRERRKFHLIKSAMRSPWIVKSIMDLKRFWTLKNFKENEFFLVFWH